MNFISENYLISIVFVIVFNAIIELLLLS